MPATRVYDAFGNLSSSTGAWQGPFGYAGGFGYQEDPTGLRLLCHRYYDPSTGRFLTRDPIKDGRNWYAYGGGTGAPTTQADPTGLFATSSAMMIIAMEGPDDGVPVGPPIGGNIGGVIETVAGVAAYALPSPGGDLSGAAGAPGPMIGIGQGTITKQKAIRMLIEDPYGEENEFEYDQPGDSTGSYDVKKVLQRFSQ